MLPQLSPPPLPLLIGDLLVPLLVSRTKANAALAGHSPPLVPLKVPLPLLAMD
jgi:hypothetical protein